MTRVALYRIYLQSALDAGIPPLWLAQLVGDYSAYFKNPPPSELARSLRGLARQARVEWNQPEGVTMPDERFTFEQVVLAAESAGLDLSRPLDQQGDDQPEPPTGTPEEQFARQLSRRLNDARSQWFTTGGDHAEG